MKTFAKITMLAAACMIIFTGCKKGENDPFLSLSSRTKRLCKEWKLVASSVTTTSVDNSITTTNVDNFNGSLLTNTVTTTMGGTSVTNTDSYPYSHEIEFVKDGTFDEVINADGNIESKKGIWSWVYGNESQDLSKKEAVVLTYTFDGTSTITGSSVSPDFIFILDKLSKDEIVIIIDYKNTDKNSSLIITGTMTFEAK